MIRIYSHVKHLKHKYNSHPGLPGLSKVSIVPKSPSHEFVDVPMVPPCVPSTEMCHNSSPTTTFKDANDQNFFLKPIKIITKKVKKQLGSSSDSLGGWVDDVWMGDGWVDGGWLGGGWLGGRWLDGGWLDGGWLRGGWLGGEWLDGGG